MSKIALPSFFILALLLIPARAKAESEAYFVLKQPPSDQAFIFKLTDPERIQQARDIIATHAPKIVTGIIIKQPIYYNPNWHFHFDPASVGFTDFAIEVCDGGMDLIEGDVDDAYSTWCPWTGRLVEEIPPPAKPGPGNLNPTVSVTTPYRSNSTTAATPGNEIIDINADDPDGTVTKVELFAQSIKIGELSTSPYRFNWMNLPPGTQSIFAVATDDQGASTTSKAVTFTLKPPITETFSTTRTFLCGRTIETFSIANRTTGDSNSGKTTSTAAARI